VGRRVRVPGAHRDRGIERPVARHVRRARRHQQALQRRDAAAHHLHREPRRGGERSLALGAGRAASGPRSARRS
jgi:hypothetical protein